MSSSDEINKRAWMHFITRGLPKFRFIDVEIRQKRFPTEITSPEVMKVAHFRKNRSDRYTRMRKRVSGEREREGSQEKMRERE